VTCATGGNIEYTLSLRSAHNQGNQGCHVTPEEAGSFKGVIFIDTPNLTSQNSLRNTPPSLTHNAVGPWAGDVVGHEWKRRKSLQHNN